jgi:hypothetical protein
VGGWDDAAGRRRKAGHRSYAKGCESHRALYLGRAFVSGELRESSLVAREL